MPYPEIAQQRIAQLEAEKYDNEIQLRIATRLGDQTAIDLFTQNIETINIALDEWQKEL
jgi:hypothetical protein